MLLACQAVWRCASRDLTNMHERMVKTGNGSPNLRFVACSRDFRCSNIGPMLSRILQQRLGGPHIELRDKRMLSDAVYLNIW
jgi:hypothetical protein